MAERLSPALKAVSDAVLAVASELSVEDVLQRLVHSARELAGARYAALGIPDGEGGFSRFLVSGMSDELVAALGPLPRTHGMLGVMLRAPESFRTDDIHDHPRFRGWWPGEHPDMRSFLGVPIVAPEGVIGAFYLTEKEGASAFGADDQELIELLAAHAAIAITNARLYEQARELSILGERNRLALELHDAVSQKLFSLVLSAEAAGTLLDRDARAARGQVERLGRLAREALDELRALVGELNAADPAQPYRVEPHLHTFEPAEVPADTPFVRLVQRVAAEVGSEHEGVWGTPWGSDVTALVNDAGMEAITFGPGDPDGCHAPDERCSIPRLGQCATALTRVAAELLG
jgi:GAF domain-containing protein